MLLLMRLIWVAAAAEVESQQPSGSAHVVATYTGANNMPDDTSQRGAADRSRISMHEDYEVRYWTKELGVSKDELQRAVDKVGNSVEEVRRELGKAA